MYGNGSNVKIIVKIFYEWMATMLFTWLKTENLTQEVYEIVNYKIHKIFIYPLYINVATTLR